MDMSGCSLTIQFSEEEISRECASPTTKFFTLFNGYCVQPGTDHDIQTALIKLI